MALSLLALLAFSPAHASYVTSVGEDVTIGLSGNFARLGVADDGSYLLFWAAGGDYNRIPLQADFSYNDQERVGMTGHTDIIDNAIRLCPDGTWLHTSSANVNDPNDTAYVFTYDAAFNLTSSLTLDQDSSIAHNDMPLWCGAARITGFTTDSFSQIVMPLNADGSEASRHEAQSAAQMMGGQFWRAEGKDDTLYVLGSQKDNGIQVTTYDASFNLMDTVPIPALSPEGEYAYWPQGLLRVGDYFVVVHMGHADNAGWDADTGNVYLSVVSFGDWEVVEQTQLTAYEPGSGAMRPWAVRDGEDLLVSFDKDLHPHVMRVGFDAEGLGEFEGEDSGADPDTDPDTSADSSSDTGTPGPDCGCASGGRGHAAGWALVVAVALGRGRRRG